MNDSYLDFANSALGARQARALGLPQPLVLKRYQAGEPVIKGLVLLGGGQPQLLAARGIGASIAWVTGPASSGLTGNLVRVCAQSMIGA